MPRSIPPPPRALLISLAMMTAFCFLGGAVVNHLTTHNTKPAGWKAVNQPLPSRVTDIRFFVPDEEGAMHLKEEYEAKGFHVAVRPVQNKFQTPSGYIVAERMDPIAAQPTADALSKVYHFIVSVKPETGSRTLVQIGPVYKRKEDAEKTVQDLKRLGYQWHIEENLVENVQNQFELRFSRIPVIDALEMKNSLSKNGINVELIQTP